MNSKKLLGVLVFSLLFFSVVHAITVTDTTATTDASGITVNDLTTQTANITQQQAQSFAQINAKITDLANQISSLRDTETKNHAESMLKSDLPQMYAQISAENKAFEVNILMDVIVVETLFLCIILIFVAKNMFPQYRREKPVKEPAPTTTQNEYITHSNNEVTKKPIIMEKKHYNANPAPPSKPAKEVLTSSAADILPEKQRKESVAKAQKILDEKLTPHEKAILGKKLFNEKDIHEEPIPEPILPNPEEVL